MEEDDSDITVAIQGSNEVILKVRRLEDVDAARLVQAAEHAAGCKGFLFCPEGRVIFSGAPLMKGEYHYRPYIHVQGAEERLMAWLQNQLALMEDCIRKMIGLKEPAPAQPEDKTL